MTDDWRYPYRSPARYHLQHTHLFASDIDATIAFWTGWFDGVVTWDGSFADARNVFMKIGIGAIHLYEQPPRDLGHNAVHHLGMQVVGIEELHTRMTAAGLSIRSEVRRFPGGAYFMVEAPDRVLVEVFEPGEDADPHALAYYGLTAADDPQHYQEADA